MRGPEPGQVVLFSYVALEERIPVEHPLRALKALVEPVLTELSPRFAPRYARTGRSSIPPEQLLRALLLQVLYTIRSERQLIGQLDYNLLYRWFVGLGQAEIRGLLSTEHLTVDGTLLEAWASQKSFQPKDEPGAGDDGDPGHPTVRFRGKQRRNATHASTSDPEARLAKKGPGKEAKLSYLASVTLDNRHGLVVATAVDSPSGTGEREQAVVMLSGLTDGRRRATVGADRGYATREFVRDIRGLGIAPHVAQGAGPPVLDGRTTRTPGTR